jgi:hypothetical protein
VTTSVMADVPKHVKEVKVYRVEGDIVKLEATLTAGQEHVFHVWSGSAIQIVETPEDVAYHPV